MLMPIMVVPTAVMMEMKDATHSQVRPRRVRGRVKSRLISMPTIMKVMVQVA